MKKLVSVCLLSTMSVMAAHAAPASGASAAQSKVGRRVMVREYQPYSVEAAKGWYLGGRLGSSFLSFSNNITVSVAGAQEDVSDDYSFETVFGGSLFAGTDFQLGQEWFRGEFEAGLIGRFEDKTAGTGLQLTVPYLMANGYYDFTNGLYVGAGFGLAVPKVELDGPYFVVGDSKKTGMSPIIGLMAGWSYDIDARMTLDLRYRLAGFWGPDITRSAYVYDDLNNSVLIDVNADLEFVLENSLSVGLRYRF